jgi:hypothetical protein
VLSLESLQIRRNHNWLKSLSFFFSPALRQSRVMSMRVIRVDLASPRHVRLGGNPGNCLDGQITNLPVQPLWQKYFCLRQTQITSLYLHPVPIRGAFRDRHGRGVGCGGRGWCH